jgi:hypothetical protein
MSPKKKGHDNVDAFFSFYWKQSFPQFHVQYMQVESTVYYDCYGDV